MLREKNGGTRNLLEQRLAANREQLENQRLRAEASNLKRRNRELELALRDALETDEDYEDGSVNNEGITISAGRRFDAPQKLRTLGQDTFEQDTKFHARTMDEHQHLLTPSSQEVLLKDADRITVETRPPISVKVRPLIRGNGANDQTYGQIAELAAPMFTSVIDAVGTLGSLGRFATVSWKGNHGCAERTLNTHSTFWTIEYPGHFTCKTCFNRKQPCLRAIGDHQWIVLPLPPATRSPDTVWQDKAYHVSPYEETSQRFPGTWRLEHHSKRDALKREREAAVAN